LQHGHCGLGDSNAHFRVFIANRPNFQFSRTDNGLHAVQTGEIYAIGQACGNGWRKVFNVYAKLYYALQGELLAKTKTHSSWQAYRDDKLLQKGSDTALIFCEPEFAIAKGLHIIMGRTYAKSLQLPNTLVWLNQEFAIDTFNRIIVCPYFDYRQLSNQKILFLVELIKTHFSALLTENR